MFISDFERLNDRQNDFRCWLFMYVMIYLFAPYRFNAVENRNGHPQADEHSKSAFSVVE